MIFKEGVEVKPIYHKLAWVADNEAVQYALDNGYDYILRLDDDIYGIEFGDVKKLYNAQKYFITGLMPLGGPPYANVAFKKQFKEDNLIDIALMKSKGKFEEIDESLTGVQEVDMTATPFALIKTETFNMIKRPKGEWFEYIPKCPPDSIFCQRLDEVGIPRYVHMDIRLSHKEVTPHNRLPLSQAYLITGYKENAFPEDSEEYQRGKQIVDNMETTRAEIKKKIILTHR
jgi:glycosyltransferase involved in cell wall biosynthesis